MENIWKQPKCPSMDEWIKKIWYVYTMDYYSDMEKEGTQTVWIRLWGHYAKWNKADRYYMISKNKQKKELIDTENTQVIAKGESWGRGRWNQWKGSKGRNSVIK